MKNLTSLALRHEQGRLLILDQTRLPAEEVWIEAKTPDEMFEYIQCLQVRGAPLIGIAAVLSLAKFREAGASPSEIRQAADHLRRARPTAVNLMNAIDRVLLEIEQLPAIAEAIFDEDVRMCEAIARNGMACIEEGEAVLTHCNSGALVSAGIGTALGILTSAHRSGKKIHVFVDETRPLLQGARLTAWELSRAGVPYTLICDNMAAALMAQKRIQRVFVGADRIALNGDFANKIGTYGVAVLSHFHEIPFYTAAPITTVDKTCKTGRDIPIEERAAFEVTGFQGGPRGSAGVQWASATTPVHNPAFDVTPRELLSGIVLDLGFLSQEELLLHGVERATLTGFSYRSQNGI